jgi:hypothetical protein
MAMRAKIAVRAGRVNTLYMGSLERTTTNIRNFSGFVLRSAATHRRNRQKNSMLGKLEAVSPSTATTPFTPPVVRALASRDGA